MEQEARTSSGES